MTYNDNLNDLNSQFDNDDNRAAAALNTLLSAFGGKYTTLYGVEVRAADHAAFGGHMYGKYVLVTVNANDITVGTSAFDSVLGHGGKSFAFEQADDVYSYVESMPLIAAARAAEEADAAEEEKFYRNNPDLA